MNWQEVCKDSTLQDLPYKIELDRFGQIVMSPASNRHGRFQMRLGSLLVARSPEGEVISECSVQTSGGTKVADVAWLSGAFLELHGLVTPYPKAPELCVEITSPSNSEEQMAHKRQVYFQSGAKEVWFCDESGRLQFFNADGEVEDSGLFPRFPRSI